MHNAGTVHQCEPQLQRPLSSSEGAVQYMEAQGLRLVFTASFCTDGDPSEASTNHLLSCLEECIPPNVIIALI